MKERKLRVPVLVFIITFVLLAFVQLKVENPMLLAERFFKGTGWIEILLISFYGAFVAMNMQDVKKVPRWRKTIWTVFSVVFFTQLLAGLTISGKFLMTGKLHLPIPMMILGGPLYRGQLSVMTILFLSTVILTGPAWCSQFCYFGAFDNVASTGRTKKGTLKYKAAIKSSVLVIVIVTALLLRWLEVPSRISTIMAVVFGLAGIGVMAVFSSREKKMVHCSVYCPIGTVVNLSKHINPFRLYIADSCTSCMKCTAFCKYDSLSPANINNHKPAIGCTLCGDCLAGCNHDSIRYKFFNLKPETARNLYLILTVSLHATCLALARI